MSEEIKEEEQKGVEPDVLAQLASQGMDFKTTEDLVQSFVEKEKTIEELKATTAKVLEQNAVTQKQIETLIAAMSNRTNQEKDDQESVRPRETSTEQQAITPENLDQFIEQRERRRQEEAIRLRQEAAKLFTDAFGDEAEELRNKHANAIADMTVASAIAFIKGTRLNTPSTGKFIRTEQEDNSTTSKFGKITQKSDREFRKTNPQAANSIPYIQAMSEAIKSGSYYEET